MLLFFAQSLIWFPDTLPRLFLWDLPAPNLPDICKVDKDSLHYTPLLQQYQQEEVRSTVYCIAFFPCQCYRVVSSTEPLPDLFAVQFLYRQSNFQKYQRPDTSQVLLQFDCDRNCEHR